MVIDEHYQQVSSGSDFGGVRSCTRVVASVLPCFQPEEIHSASVVCLLGTQGVFEDRLSGLGCPFARLSEFGGGHSSLQDPALYDVAESYPSLVGRSSSATAAVHDHPSAHEAQETRAARGDGLDRTGIEPSQSVLCATTRSDRRLVEKHDLPSLSQIGTSLHNRFALRARISQRSRAIARCCGLPAPVGGCAPTSSIDFAGCGCRLRLRSQPPIRSRNMSCANDHSREPWSQNKQTGAGTIPAFDANSLRRHPLPRSLPNRNGRVDDQTPPRIVPPQSHVLEPMSRPSLEGPHSQHHDS